MAFENLGDYLPVFLAFVLTSTFTIVMMWWKGMFRKIETQTKQEINHLKGEAGLEKSDALSNLMITNIIAQLEDTKEKLGEAAGDLSEIKTRVAVVETDIGYIRKMIEEVKSKLI